MRAGWKLTLITGVLVFLAGSVAPAQIPRRVRPAPIQRLPPSLNTRERVEQMLARFTYGARPGEVDRVLAKGADGWFEAQLSPGSLPDDALNKRLGDFPTVAMTPAQALAVFPDRPQVAAVAQGKTPMPTDPTARAVMEVQVSKWNAEQDRKKTEPSAKPVSEPTDTEKAAQRQADQAAAARLAGELFALPKNQRMAALAAMPVPERIVLTANGNLSGQQRDLLLRDFAPREREAFLAMGAQVSSTGNLVNELAQAHFVRDILSERQIEAVMTDLWFNHFNIFLGKDADQYYTASYEREVIRAHALGKFRDLLLATATSPAMQIYLDNAQSIGPNSLANGVNPANPKSRPGNRGLNENYGREVMELHTVGVNGGYTQADVTALAAILTGWGVDKPQDGGPFLFDPKRHEPGAKAWFGYCIAENGAVAQKSAGYACEPDPTPVSPASMQQGIAALKILAADRHTAAQISTMLAQYFVADIPPQALVDRLTQVYLANDGDIRTMLRTIVNSPEFNSRQYFRVRVKTPVEFLVSAYRATGTEPQNPGALVNAARTMGMPVYYALPPVGYYLTADRWMNANALVGRLNFAYQLTNGKLPNQPFDSPRLLAMSLMQPGELRLGPEPYAAVKAGDTGTRSPAATMRNASTASGAVPPGPEPLASGVQLAASVLEASMTSSALQGKTRALIQAQIAQQPGSASAADTLNLITGLLLGSPEFQLR